MQTRGLIACVAILALGACGDPAVPAAAPTAPATPTTTTTTTTTTTPGAAAGSPEGGECGDDVAIQKKCAAGLVCKPNPKAPVSEHTPGICKKP
jgi:hypothetical protein